MLIATGQLDTFPIIGNILGLFDLQDNTKEYISVPNEMSIYLTTDPLDFLVSPSRTIQSLEKQFHRIAEIFSNTLSECIFFPCFQYSCSINTSTFVN